MSKESKDSIIKRLYLDEQGCSEPIDRYDLPKPLAYTSGDSPFRNDGPLGKEYKMFRFSRTLDFNTKVSNCWSLSDEDKSMIQSIHKKLDFPKEKKGNDVCFIQFFGKGDKINDQSVRQDIFNEIRKKSCANCGTNTNIECDHKNDLKNDKRVLIKETQTLDDFQPLCKHCNATKREVLKKMKKTNKRIGAKYLHFKIDFTEGDETLNIDDPNWYKGTYWGDCIKFKQSI